MVRATHIGLFSFALIAGVAYGQQNYDWPIPPGGIPIPDNNPSGIFVDLSVPDPFILPPGNSVEITLTFGNPPSSLGHTWAGDLRAVLTLNNTFSTHLFNRIGAANGVGAGDSSDMLGPYNFTKKVPQQQGGPADIWTAAFNAPSIANIPAQSYYATNTSNIASSAPPIDITQPFAGQPANGIWRLTISDNTALDTGRLMAARLTLKPPPQVTIPQGVDCWSTQCGNTMYDFSETPIPCSFFDPGSEPFDDKVLLGGGDPGDIDTRVRRNADINFGSPLPDTQTVPIELVSLNLVSCSPITVRYCTGLPDELWDVSVGLSPAPVPPPGTMTVTKTHANGGYFTSDFFVQPVFTFRRQSDGAIRVLDTGLEAIPPMFLDSTEPVPWVHNATIPVIICGVNFVPGVQEAGAPPTPGSFCVTALQCCRPARHSSEPPFTCPPPPCPPFSFGGHNHQTEPPNCNQCACGACCMPDGACVEFAGFNPAGACADAAGMFMGIGSSCTSADGDTIPDSYETNNCCAPGPCPPNGLCSTPTDPTRADTDGDGLNDDADSAPCNRCLPLGAPLRPAICDQFDLTLPGDGDCDDDGICDLCEIQAGTSHDCNDNGVPDECEPDCNNNGLPDDYDISCGISLDCNANGIPDECEAGCPSCLGDINGDGLLDGRDIRCFILCMLSCGAPGCNCGCADMDGSGTVNIADIDPFVAAILAKPSVCPGLLEVAAPVIGAGPGRLRFNVSVELGGPFGGATTSGEGSLRLDTAGVPSFFDVFWHSDGDPGQNIPAFTVQIPGQTPIQDNGALGTSWTLNGSVDIIGDPDPGNEPDADVQVSLLGPPLAQLGDAGARYTLDTAVSSQAVVRDPQAFGGLPQGTQIPITQHPVKIKKYCIYLIQGCIGAGGACAGIDPGDYACVECDARQKPPAGCPGGPVEPPTKSVWWLVPPPPGIGGTRVVLVLIVPDCTGCDAEHFWRFGGWEDWPKP